MKIVLAGAVSLFGHEEIKRLCAFEEEIIKVCGKEKKVVDLFKIPEDKRIVKLESDIDNL